MIEIILNEVLEPLRLNNIEAVLAGGAIRDTLLGRRVKDWDIFVFTHPSDDLKALRKKIRESLNADFEEVDDLEGIKDYDYHFGSRIKGIMNFNLVEEDIFEGSIQIILLNSTIQNANQLVSTFPLGISQGFMDVTGAVFLTPIMMRDIADKEITLTLEVIPLEQGSKNLKRILITYIPKILEKYSEFGVRIAGES